LRKIGAKNIEVGVGCGVGFGHGFGAGNFFNYMPMLQQHFLTVFILVTQV